MKDQECVFLTNDQASDLVDRIAKRAENFDYKTIKDIRDTLGKRRNVLNE